MVILKLLKTEILIYFAVIEFKTSYDFDLKEFNKESFKSFLNDFKNNNESVIEMPLSPLIIDLNDGLKFTINIKTKNRQHIGIERAFRKELINYFNNKGLNIKVPLVLEEK